MRTCCLVLLLLILVGLGGRCGPHAHRDGTHLKLSVDWVTSRSTDHFRQLDG